MDKLIGEELDAVFGAPLPCTKDLVADYIAFLRNRVLYDSEGHALSSEVGEVERVLVEDLAKQGRAADGGGVLTFQPDRRPGLRRVPGGANAILALVSGVPQGHRVAKLLQLLDEDAGARAPWVYVGDEAPAG